MKKLFKNQKGFSHHFLIPLIVILLIVGVGVYLLTKSHAEELSQAGSAAKSASINVTRNQAGVVTAVNGAKVGAIKFDPEFGTSADQKMAIGTASSGAQLITYYWDSDADGCSRIMGMNNCQPQSVIGHNPNTGSGSTGLCLSSTGCVMPWRVNKIDSSHYDWYGPYRNMQVPSNAHGIRACVRYLQENPLFKSQYQGTIYNAQTWATFDMVFHYTHSNGVSQMISLAPSKGIHAQSIENGASSNDHVVCIYSDKNGPSIKQFNGRFNGVEARIHLDGADFGPTDKTFYLGSFDIIRTSLSYW